MCKVYTNTVCLIVLLLLWSPASAQWQGDFSGSDFDSQTALKTTREQNVTFNNDLRLINVYSVKDQRVIAQIPASSAPVLVGSQGDKWRVTFAEPTIPVWVSAEYVDIEPDSQMATVTASVLNVRTLPALSAPRLTQLYKGYTSRILSQQSGFIRILAPANLEVLLDQTEGNSGNARVAENVATQIPEPVENTATAPNEAENTHLLAPGDSISLLVFGEPDLSAQNVRVPQSGRVSFPLIGPVVVLGKTTTDIEQEVAALLSQGYVRNPRISVSIFSYRPIFIRGEVGLSGAFPYSEGLTVAKAIALAGGLTDSAKTSGISITRDGHVIAEGLSVDSQRTVASGDIVSISADLEVKQAESSYVYLHGEVVQAGAYEYKKGLTVEKAVVLAGGFTLRASKKKIHISRYESAEENGAPTELKRVKLYAPVKPGDVIKVGASWF